MSGNNCPFTCSSCVQCSNGYNSTAAHVSFPNYTTTGQSSTSWFISPFSNYEIWYPGHSNGYAAHASEPQAGSASKCQCTTFRMPAQIVSACCGGSCKCSPIIVCQCAATCCGCCDGCSCSSDGEREEPQPRLGFAVSGERSSDPSMSSKPIEMTQKEPLHGTPYPRKNKRRIEVEANSGESVQLHPIAEYRPGLPFSISSATPASEEVSGVDRRASLRADRWSAEGFHYNL